MAWSDIPGWTDDNLLRVYQDAVDEGRDGDVFVELGVAFGRSLAYMCERIMASGKNLRVVGIDSFEVTHWREPELTAIVEKSGSPFTACLDMLRTHRAAMAYANIIKSTGSVMAAQWMGPLRFCFIDGDHSRESVAADIADWWPLVSPGGVLAGHDYGASHPGVEEAVRAGFPKHEVVGSCWRVRK
jgi:cephalosporin hydroxylase